MGPPRIAHAALDLELRDEQATAALAGRLAAAVRTGDVIALRGDLGAGKTLLARAFVNALPGAREEVPSPTFTLAQTYRRGDLEVWHFDLYRLESPEEAYELGIEEAFAEAVSLIEWPERLGALLPKERLDLWLEQGAEAQTRRLRLEGHGGWAARLAAIFAEPAA